MIHTLKVLFLLAVLCGTSLGLYNVEKVKFNVIKRIEGIYETIWHIPSCIPALTNYTEEFLNLCTDIKHLDTRRIPPLFMAPVLIRYGKPINSHFDHFCHLVEHEHPINGTGTWSNFTKAITGDNDESAEETFYSIVTIIYHSSNEGIFRLSNWGPYPYVCFTSQSTQQSLFNLYLLVQSLQLKAYAMLQLVHSYLRPNKEKAENLREDLYFRLQRQKVAINITLRNGSREYWIDGLNPSSLEVNYTSLESCKKVSLLPSRSKIRRNRIIVGLRFIRKEDVLYVQAKEGILIPDGKILNGSIDWVPLPSTDQQTPNNTIALAPGQINFFHRNNLVPNKVLTGVKFVKEGSAVVLAIQGTNFSLEKGELLLFHGKKPSKRHWVHSHPRKDGPVAKTIDIQDVTPDPEVPLSGVGTIFFKKRGGCLVPKIYTLDVVQNLDTLPAPFRNLKKPLETKHRPDQGIAIARYL